MADVVVDASALVDLLLGLSLGAAVEARVRGHTLHAPAHVDAEVLSALGRLNRAGEAEAGAVEALLAKLAAAPIERHPVSGLLTGAWARRHDLRLADALYIGLATALNAPLVTTDRRLRAQATAEVVEAY